MSGLFNLPPSRSNRSGDSNIVKKATSTRKAPTINVKGGGGLMERINTIVAMVEKHLGKYKDDILILRTEQQLSDYVDLCIEQKYASLDTETDSLDPLTCTLAGVCLYAKGHKAAYAPCGHVSFVTGVRVENQLEPEVVAKHMKRLVDSKPYCDWFNAKFDIRVMRSTLGLEFPIDWCGYAAARLLNENEGDGNNNLKRLHNKYVKETDEAGITFDTLFKGVPATYIPIKTFALYAAMDGVWTAELNDYQRKYLGNDRTERLDDKDMDKLSELWEEIEKPVIVVTANLEDRGVNFDFEVAHSLSKEYNEKLKESDERIHKIIEMYEDEIAQYRARMGASCKLSNPINYASPAQLAILLYDIMGEKVVDKNKPRGTGEEILQKMDNPLCEAILKHRGIAKLLSTYIEKLPNEVNEKTGRIHANFNPSGTDTGRYSSKDPNLQNIPSKNKEIRKMFRASKDHVLISSDYSAQEPRITSHMSKDEKMIQAYKDGKDLYAEVAAIAFQLPYDECLEFRSDGTKNDKGKERRNTAKAIVLGVCYGKGIPAIASDLNITVKRAQEIYNKIMQEFPGLEQFMYDSEQMARELGYVTTVWGRKRRLPRINMPPFEFSYINGISADYDPLSDDLDDEDDTVPDDIVDYYTDKLNKAKGFKQTKGIIAEAKEEGIQIIDNRGYIAEAIRQCVNARIQGSAADMTKKAMILIENDEELKELGYKLLLPVHDELIGECPDNPATIYKVCVRKQQLMVEAAKELDVPSKCDVEVTYQWFGEPIEWEDFADAV